MLFAVDDSTVLLLFVLGESIALSLLAVDESTAVTSSFIEVPLFRSMKGTGCRSSNDDNIVMLLIFVAFVSFLLR